MKPLFIDAGGFRGCSVRLFLANYPYASEYEIIVFEPNERFNSCYAGLPVTVRNQAVWTTNCTLPFYLTSNPNGNTLLGSKLAVDESDFCIVECIDFSEFLRNQFSPGRRIIVKLDIEGAEYEVIERLMDDHTIDLITELYVDWHVNKLFDAKDKHKRVISRLREIHVVARYWAFNGVYPKNYSNLGILDDIFGAGLDG